MDTFEILNEICETRDRSVAKGMAFQDATNLAERKISKKYHITFKSVKNMIET
jgi:hypothetical protein